MVLIKKSSLALDAAKYLKLEEIIFNFPGAPFMAAAKRSQFEQFAQRFPSNFPETNFATFLSFFLLQPTYFLPPFFLFQFSSRFSVFLHVFFSNLECKSQRKVVKLLKFDFPRKFGWKWRTCWFNFYFVRHFLNMRLALMFYFHEHIYHISRARKKNL